MSELDDLDPLARTIEPLPGGLGQLRERLHRRDSRRRPLAIAAAAAACCAIVGIWRLLPRPQERAPDRAAMRRLLVDADRLPNPRAVSLGLVAPAAPVVASDPRVTPSSDVVFYWVAPAEPVLNRP